MQKIKTDVRFVKECAGENELFAVTVRCDGTVTFGTEVRVKK